MTRPNAARPNAARPESRPIRYERSRAVRFFMQVLWPAFAAAALSSGLVFSAIDPRTLTLFDMPVMEQREGIYTAGFVLLWTLYTAACSVTWWITRHDAQRAARRMSLGTVPARPASRHPANREEIA